MGLDAAKSAAPLNSNVRRFMNHIMHIQYYRKILSVFATLSLSLNIAFASDISYPYYATPERASVINNGYTNIKPGLTVNEVVTIMGKPDEIRDLYEPIIKNGKKIGFTYWYLIQRIQASGSQNDKKEKLVRVSFDLNRNVSGVDRW